MPTDKFRLFAHGEEFDPDAYLASCSLKFDGVWHKGESGNGHPQSSGVFKLLGNGLAVPFMQQEKIAIEYLTANRDALKTLGQHPQVSIFIIGLEYNLTLDNSVMGFCMGPSSQFMWHCLDIGIEPVYYVSLDRHGFAQKEFY